MKHLFILSLVLFSLGAKAQTTPKEQKKAIAKAHYDYRASLEKKQAYYSKKGMYDSAQYYGKLIIAHGKKTKEQLDKIKD